MGERDNVLPILGIEKNITNTGVSLYWKTANSLQITVSQAPALSFFVFLTTVLAIDLFEQELLLSLHFSFQRSEMYMLPIFNKEAG